MLNRKSVPIMELLENIGWTNVGVIALCGIFLIFLLPRVFHRKTSLEDPANPNLSVAEYNRRGNEMYQQHLYKRAAGEYGHMIEKAPDAVDGYLLRAMAESEGGDYKGAVRDNTEALKHARLAEVRDPLYFNRGLAYRNMGDYTDAVPDFTQALALNPKNWNAYEVRAFCYTELLDYDRAIADYTVAIGHDAHPGTVFERGQAYLKKKEYPKALADLNRSLSVRPNFAPGYRLRAETYVGMKEFDQAAKDEEAALRLDNSAAGRGGLGWYQYLAGKLPEAIQNSQMAVKMDPNLTFARFNLALFSAVQGNAEAAKTAYQDTLLHAKSADIQGALQDVKDALKKQPNSPALKQAQTLLQDALLHASTTP
ncbi:MAG: peptidase caspase catalytic subunit p20 [Chthonomonadaceae bacterium]|nr:peptidase caspase catalytic subunit p20 [Chthonomonadaceae bacterium]